MVILAYRAKYIDQWTKSTLENPYTCMDPWFMKNNLQGCREKTQFQLPLKCTLRGSRWWSSSCVLAMYVGDRDWVLGSWLLPWTSSRDCRHLGVNWRIGFSYSLSLFYSSSSLPSAFQIHKKLIFTKHRLLNKCAGSFQYPGGYPYDHIYFFINKNQFQVDLKPT